MRKEVELRTVSKRVKETLEKEDLVSQNPKTSFPHELYEDGSSAEEQTSSYLCKNWSKSKEGKVAGGEESAMVKNIDMLRELCNDEVKIDTGWNVHVKKTEQEKEATRTSMKDSLQRNEERIMNKQKGERGGMSQQQKETDKIKNIEIPKRVRSEPGTRKIWRQDAQPQRQDTSGYSTASTPSSVKSDYLPAMTDKLPHAFGLWLVAVSLSCRYTP